MSYTLKQDPWLSSQLGLACSSLTCAHAPSIDELHSTLANLPSQVFCYTRLATQETAQALLLQEQGFRVVDCSIQLERARQAPQEKITHEGVRHARPADEEAVREIARSSFVYSRFHLDTRIPLARAQALKADWAGNFFHGKRGDAMIVAEKNNKVLGFLQIFIRGTELCIDLIGVSKEAQGLGLGSRMIAFAEESFPDISHLVVGTQAANTVSLRFYEKNGFHVKNCYYVLHLIKGEIA